MLSGIHPLAVRGLVTSAAAITIAGARGSLGRNVYAPAVPRPSGWIFHQLLEGNFVPAPSTLIRRCCFKDLGGFDESLVYEDFEFWLRLSLRYQFQYDRMIQNVYRVRRGPLYTDVRCP